MKSPGTTDRRPDVNDFIPPYPPPLEKRPSFWQLASRGQRCPISTLTRRAYRMKLGESRFLAMRRYYIVVEPELVKRIVTDRTGAYPKSKLMARIFSAIIGNSILVSNGEVWKRQRRLLEPAFSAARIQDAFPRMLGPAQDMLARLAQFEQGALFDVEPEMTHVTADVIMRTICSVTMTEAQAYETYEAFLAYQRIAYGDLALGLAYLPAVLSPRWWKAKTAAKRVRAVLDPHIRARYEAHARGEADHHDDMLSALLNATDPETGEPMRFEYQELVEQIAMMFLAGHETSAAALSWAVWLIAACPQIQERMHEEASSVIGVDEPRFDHMRKLTFTRDVFREALRLYPSVPFFARDATRDEPMRDKIIKAGSVLMLSPWLSHRNETMWENAQAFDPDRFSRPQTQECLRNNAYLPFSFGPRGCLGAAFAMQEATLILACIAREYRLEIIAGDTPMPVANATLRSVNGIRVRIRRRATDIPVQRDGAEFSPQT